MKRIGDKIFLVLFAGYAALILVSVTMYLQVYYSNKSLFYQAIFSMLFVVLFSSLLLYFIIKNIIRPIDNLTVAAKKAASGDLSVRVNATSMDEIGYLTSVFNDLLIVVENFKNDAEENQKKLEQLNLVLESKVEERTKELEEIRNNLEALVEQRTAELQQKLIELERFRDLTVGRELKMIELKKKLGELSKIKIVEKK